MAEVELKEIVGVWSRGIGELVVGVSFATIDPESLLDDGVCLAPSKRSVNTGGLLVGSRVPWGRRILGGCVAKLGR